MAAEAAEVPVDDDVEPSTRDQILRVSLRAFAEHGFHATSLNEIADAVGIRRQSLLHHFPSKEILYKAVVADALADWISLVDSSVDHPVEGWAQVERVIRAGFRFFEEHPEVVRIVRHEALDGGPILSAELHDILRAMFDRAVGFFEREMDAGRLRRYDSRQLLLAGYGASLSYFSDAPLTGVLLDSDPLAPENIQAHMELLLEMFRRALDPAA